jgi:hypothetical protein
MFSMLSGCGTSREAGMSNAVLVPSTPCRHERTSYDPATPSSVVTYLDSLTSVQQKTAIAQSPQVTPPSRHPAYVSRERAVTLARLAARSEYSPAAPATAPVTARLMTILQYERRLGEGIGYGVNVHRKLWVVMVHARTVNTEGRRPLVYSVYTLVIDGESGTSFMYLAGCDPFAG